MNEEKDVEAIMPTKEHYLRAIRELHHKGGWTITAEKQRKSYNRLCGTKKQKISRHELEYVAPDIFDKIGVILKNLWGRLRTIKVHIR